VVGQSGSRCRAQVLPDAIVVVEPGCGAGQREHRVDAQRDLVLPARPIQVDQVHLLLAEARQGADQAGQVADFEQPLRPSREYRQVDQLADVLAQLQVHVGHLEQEGQTCVGVLDLGKSPVEQDQVVDLQTRDAALDAQVGRLAARQPRVADEEDSLVVPAKRDRPALGEHRPDRLDRGDRACEVDMDRVGLVFADVVAGQTEDVGAQNCLYRAC
jgi:hypothetical protein